MQGDIPEEGLAFSGETIDPESHSVKDNRNGDAAQSKQIDDRILKRGDLVRIIGRWVPFVWWTRER